MRDQRPTPSPSSVSRQIAQHSLTLMPVDARSSVCWQRLREGAMQRASAVATLLARPDMALGRVPTEPRPWPLCVHLETSREGRPQAQVMNWLSFRRANPDRHRVFLFSLISRTVPAPVTLQTGPSTLLVPTSAIVASFKYFVFFAERKKERKQTTLGRVGRTARRHHTGILRRGVWCASRRPPLGVCLFLSLFAVPLRFSLQPSCFQLHATSRSSHSRRSLSCRFFLCRFAPLCLILRRRRCLPIPCSRLSA